MGKNNYRNRNHETTVSLADFLKKPVEVKQESMQAVQPTQQTSPPSLSDLLRPRKRERSLNRFEDSNSSDDSSDDEGYFAVMRYQQKIVSEKAAERARAEQEARQEMATLEEHTRRKPETHEEAQRTVIETQKQSNQKKMAEIVRYRQYRELAEAQHSESLDIMDAEATVRDALQQKMQRDNPELKRFVAGLVDEMIQENTNTQPQENIRHLIADKEEKPGITIAVDGKPFAPNKQQLKDLAGIEKREQAARLNLLNEERRHSGALFSLFAPQKPVVQNGVTPKPQATRPATPEGFVNVPSMESKGTDPKEPASPLSPRRGLFSTVAVDGAKKGTQTNSKPGEEPVEAGLFKKMFGL